MAVIRFFFTRMDIYLAWAFVFFALKRLTVLLSAWHSRRAYCLRAMPRSVWFFIPAYFFLCLFPQSFFPGGFPYPHRDFIGVYQLQMLLSIKPQDNSAKKGIIIG
jgi:hypothetical protein